MSRDVSRSRYYDREDRGRSDYDRSKSRTRDRSVSDDGYRSSRDISRSRSGSRYDSRSVSRSRSRDVYSAPYGYYPAPEMMMRPTNVMPAPNADLDNLLKRYGDLSVKTAQKTQDRQLIFVAIAFFIGFVFAQGILY